MRRAIPLFLLLLLLLTPCYAPAGETQYVTRQQIEFPKLLAPPPALGSPIQQKEMELLLSLQKARTPEQIALAKADAKLSVFRFADILSQKFTPEDLPITAAFFENVTKNTAHVLDPSKAHWNRLRPYIANPELVPCVEKPDNASYPSGHSTFGTVVAITLANMLPEHEAEIHARAEQYRFNREIAGAHYPSDVEAGRIAGTVIAAFMRQNEAFQADFAKAKAETRKLLGLQ
jgi:acid phosphatase (class A)